MQELFATESQRHAVVHRGGWIERIFARGDALFAMSPAFLLKPVMVLGQIVSPTARTPTTGPATQPFSILSIFTYIDNGGAATRPFATAPVPAAPEVSAAKGHAPWEQWLKFYNYQNAVTAISTFVVCVLSWWVLSRIFKRSLDKYRLQRATAWGAAAAICYATLWAADPVLMSDTSDIIAVSIHKIFWAIIAFVGIRYIDRLVVVPLLTRISGGPPSRFIHQIVITIISIFVIAGYCSSAFGIEIGSLLAGSAVISIVIGLALQETLGNFFSGMVLQASVPFQTGDWIQVGTVEGRVVEMTWRAVTLITWANNYVLIPNSAVAKEQIINYHAPTVATSTNVTVGLDYSIPPNEAKRVLIQAAVDTPGVLADPPPSAGLMSFDDSSIAYKVFFWINEPQKHGKIEQAVRVNLWYRLNQAGYGIPFPIRTVELTDFNKKQEASRQEAHQARLATLRKSPMFSELSLELQEQLASETRAFQLAAGQAFYRQNDPGDSLFILESGSVEVTFKTDAGTDLHVTDFEAPAVFGEVSAVTGQPRAATYHAKTDARVIEIDRDHLQGLFSRDPQLMDHFSKLISERQKQRDDLLQNIGAEHAGTDQQAHEQTVLDRMKRIFTLLHR